MKKSFYVILLVLFLPALIHAQVDVDTIFLWDNDRGEYYQTAPAVGKRTWGAYVAWVDSRWGDYDIYRQAVFDGGGYNGKNTMVSVDEFNEYIQNYPDIESNSANYMIAVWEDSSYQPGSEGPSQIWASIHTGSPFMVYGNERSQKRPAVSCRNNGDFVVTWTSYNENDPAVICRRYNRDGGFEDQYEVKVHMEFFGRIPLSKPAYCDSGFLIVFEDTLDDDTQRSIFGQYRKVDGGLLVDFKKISLISVTDKYNEAYPDVAVNEDGNMVVVWQDRRNENNWDIYAQQLQATSDGFEFVGEELKVATSNADEYRPQVALFGNGNFVVVWFEARAGNFDIAGRTYVQGDFRPEFTVNATTTGHQWFPDAACRYGDTLFVAWQSQQDGNFDKVYCRSFRYLLDSEFGVEPVTTDIPVTPDTCYPGGRKCWYFDDENYDNPATPWNEDPIAEAESVYVDLEFAMVDQIMELNTNGQYFIVCEDTLPSREQDVLLTEYDAVFLDLGYRTLMSSAGVITTEEQNTLVDYIDPLTGDGKPAMVDGNDFGYMYDGTDFFKLFGAEYLGDGAPYTAGNIDTIFGIEGVFSENETLMYDYKGMVDNYIDSLDALPPAKMLLYSSGAPTDWMAGRAVFWGSYWKSRERGGTIYNSFIPAGITSTTHPHTYAEYYRRCIGFLGLNCQPEPITTLEAVTGSSEGRVTITWDVVSDDSLRESAAGDYKLKFAREKMTSETAFENAEEYYQTWYTGDSAVGATVTQNLYGLPPMDTLVFALKVSDESNLWNALGAEPQAVVEGDSVTPHYIYVGSNYVKDFSNKYEFLHRRNDDSLFVTWNTSYFFVGFARCDFRSFGDLFIYVDTKSGGCDSTYDYNGSGAKSYFNCNFDPDYLFLLEDNTTHEYKKWDESADQGRGAWVDTSFGVGWYSEDGVVNDFLYTEVRMPFNNMGYNASNTFKLVVLVGREGTNQIINAYPIFNPVGTGVNITQYYYWTHLGSGMVPKYSAQVIGIEEETEISDLELMGKALLVTPNPFNSTTRIVFGMTEWVDIAEIKIFDITGRLVKRFEFENLQTEVNQINWNGTDELGRKLPGGVYFCEYTCGEKTEIEKVIFIR